MNAIPRRPPPHTGVGPTVNLTEEQFRQLMIAALEESPRARAIVRQAFLPTFPVAGAVTCTSITSSAGGTTGKLPYFDAQCSIADSIVYQSGTKIGINTSTPAFNLDLNGAVFMIGTKTAAPGQGGTMRFRDDTGTQRWLFGMPGTAGSQDFQMYNYSNGHAPLFIQNGAASYSLYLHGNGNVGVGTSSPAQKLDVNGGINASGSVGIGTAAPLSKLDVAGGVAIGSYAGANAAPSNGMIVSGNVGLGVTNPPEKLTAAVGSNMAIYMSTPGQPNGTATQVMGGTLSGNYWYKIVAVDGQGNTTAAGPESAEVSVTGSNNAVSLNWTPVPGASYYRVYRGSSSGSENAYVPAYTNPFVDIGASGTSGMPPSTTTAYFVKLDSVSGAVLSGSVILGGAQTKQTSGGPEQLSFQHGDKDHVAFACFVGSDGNFQFGASLRGFMEWGPGNADQDTALYRTGSGGGIAIESFNNTFSKHALSVQRPTAAGAEVDFFRASTMENLVEMLGSVSVAGTAFTAAGMVTVNAGTLNTVNGTNTLFTQQVAMGDKVTVDPNGSAETSTVSGIISDTQLTVNPAFSSAHANKPMTITKQQLLQVKNSSGASLLYVPDQGVLQSRAMSAAKSVVTFSATPTFDASLGNTQVITLTAAVTSSTLSNAVAGQWLVFDVIQDATGGWTFTWPLNVKGGDAVNGGANKHNVQMFYFDGTNAHAAGPMKSSS